ISARKAEACEQTARELSADGGRCIALPADVSTVEGARALAAAFTGHEPRLDILVNNAGAAWAADFDEFPESGWDKVVDLNLKTPFFLTQALAGALRKSASAERPAKVINIASIDGIFVNPLETYPYAASKAGLIHLTRRMAARLVREHIVVSAIAPGPFGSNMNRAARDDAENVARRVPAGRVGTDEDQAGAASSPAPRARATAAPGAGRPGRYRRGHGGCRHLPRLARRRLRRRCHRHRRRRHGLRAHGLRRRQLGGGLNRAGAGVRRAGPGFGNAMVAVPTLGAA